MLELVNKKLADETEPRSTLEPCIDSAIDEINMHMNTIFPVLSELTSTVLEYTAIPDKYIRMIIIPYAAWSYYVTDEEGINAPVQYQQDAAKGLFAIIRDYSESVPEEYQEDMYHGGIPMKVDTTDGSGLSGVTVSVSNIRI